jgi:hypothetical protein
MGKASSAKKVARAARSSSSSKRQRPKLAFPLSIFVIIVVGALLVVYARTTHDNSAAADVAPSYVKQDHWHAAYGIYVCDHFLPNLTDVKEDTLGIHTHGEGVIHIHPFAASSSGTRAQMSVFAAQVGLKFTDQGFVMPDGTTYENGYQCNGKPSKVAVYKWIVDDPTAPIQVYEQDFGKINFTEDRAAYTIAVLPEGAPEPPPKPDSVAELDKLSDVAGNSAPSASTPDVSTPDVSTPDASTPAVSVPTVSTPTVSTPAVPTPTVPTTVAAGK